MTRSADTSEEEVALRLTSNSDEELHHDGDNSASFDSAIEKAGFGKFHYWLLFVCGWANASDAIEILCISFLLPSAECDLKLSSSDKGWLSAIMFVGMLVGGYAWGSASDVFGRRKTLIVAMFVNALCGSASGLAKDKAAFFLMRFLSGVGVGGSIPVVWTYFGEFQPNNKRGMMLSCLASFWMVGNITVAVVAWMIIPGGGAGEVYPFNTWRIFVFVCGLPAFAVALMLLTLPESPKYLLMRGKPLQALKTLSYVFAKNSNRTAVHFPVDRLVQESDGPSQRKKGSFATRAVENTLNLFAPSILRTTSLMLYVNFAIAFGYYGLWLWFPELFNKLDLYRRDHPNATVSVCEITDYKPPPSDSQAEEEEEYSCHGPPRREVFFNSICISLAALPGNVWTITHMDNLGRKFFLVLSMVLSGFSAFLVYLVKSSDANLVVSCIFGLVSTAGFNALDCLGVEVFPTSIRSTGLAVTLIAARLGAVSGNVVFGYLIESNCAVPIISVSVLLISGGILGLALPDTNRLSLG